jgi:hypothetical protein
MFEAMLLRGLLQNAEMPPVAEHDVSQDEQ